MKEPTAGLSPSYPPPVTFKGPRCTWSEEIATRLRDLRYLSIQDTPISEIPDQIGQLQHLMTLDLRGTRVQELPASVLQQRLTHLLCDLFVAFLVTRRGGEHLAFPLQIEQAQ
jgi:Leucine-rich repeat (LRR) protein